MNTFLNRLFGPTYRRAVERSAPFDHPDIARMNQRMRDDLPTPRAVQSDVA